MESSNELQQVVYTGNKSTQVAQESKMYKWIMIRCDPQG